MYIDGMSSPIDPISHADAGLVDALSEFDALERVRLMEQATDQVAALRNRVSIVRAQMMQEYVDEVGASKAARELGISRGRVYQITTHDD